MARTNEATDVDLKVIEDLGKLGWRRGDTLFYQQEYQLTPEQQTQFPPFKSIKPDIVLTDYNSEILAVYENKLDDEKKALTKLRTLYRSVLKPRFLYACSSERVLFYDTAWKGLDAGEFRRVNSFLTLEEMKGKLEQELRINLEREIKIDTSIAGGYDEAAGKDRYFQTECINALIEKYKAGKQKMLVHMATGLGKTRTAVALSKALLEYGLAKRILFVVDRILLAKQARDDGFSLISSEFPSEYIRSSNYRQHRNKNIHIVVIDTLENIYQDIPSSFYDLLIVDECHRSVNINRKLIFDHFLCPRIGLTATPRNAIAAKGANISEDDLAILDTYRLFGCETEKPDYQFDLQHGIDEGFLAPYKPQEIKTFLTREAEEKGVEFDYVLDPDERKKIELDETKKLWLEQLNRKYLSEEMAARIAEEIRKNSEYGEKIILFAPSQPYCRMLVNALNKELGVNGEDGDFRYAEAIISDNAELNDTLKSRFKKANRKPYIAVSVDIMSTGVDIPCVRYIAFSALTKSVGKYIQMLGRGTRLDPKTGKFSFTVLDFVGLCKRMEDNGKGSPKKNVKIVKGTDTGGGGVQGPKGEWFIIDNPDPAELIQRVWIHGDNIRVIDNIPIADARELFERELQKAEIEAIVNVKKKAKASADYVPTDEDLEQIREWAKNPEVYLDESQLQKIYNFSQGSIWDFFLHALGMKKLPTLEERVEKGFDSYLATYDFTDEQIRTLRKVKDILVSNLAAKKPISADTMFSNPVFEHIIGSREAMQKKFGGKLDNVLREIEKVVVV